ncbi:hypothetical protein AB0D65_26755 [Streptomyces griseoloalbus]|uniref:Uncharacterized protein n=1 Tax=Streptomyces griseoloalbus TaxID=67303 RepID=A0ABV3EBF1_9ACTN
MRSRPGTDAAQRLVIAVATGAVAEAEVISEALRGVPSRAM